MPIFILEEPPDPSAAYNNFRFRLAFTQNSQAADEKRFMLVELVDANTGMPIVDRMSFPYRDEAVRGWRMDFGNDMRGHLYVELPNIRTTSTTVTETNWRRSVRLIYGEKIINLTTKTVTENYPLGNSVYSVTNANYQFDEVAEFQSGNPLICTRKPHSFCAYRGQTDWIYFCTNGEATIVRVQRLRQNMTVINTGVYNQAASNNLIGMSTGGYNGHLKPTTSTYFTRIQFEVAGVVTDEYLIRWKSCPHDFVHREIMFLNSFGGYDTIFFENVKKEVQTAKLSYRKKRHLNSVLNDEEANNHGLFQYGSVSRQLITLSTEIDLVPDKLEYKEYLDDFAASSSYYITHKEIQADEYYYAAFEVLDLTIITSNDQNRATITVVGRLSNEIRTVEQR